MFKIEKVVRSVPTNIITGFLGVGKTSAILNLMKHKPDNERWAVLVNEFGEIGVDGALVSGQTDEQEVFIREVPGGCMCCAAGLPMQIALNQLLQEAKPDRLLIEPTGLGHPREVLEILKSDNYKGVLVLQKTLTLVDPRKLSDRNYTDHPTFNQQIAIADTIIGNKIDLYGDDERQTLRDYTQKINGPDARIIFAQDGQFDTNELNGETRANSRNYHHHPHDHETRPLASELEIPESGYLKATNQGEGYQSVGWRFAPNKIFDRQRLFDVLITLRPERLKAVFITDDGIYGFNYTADGMTVAELDDAIESRIELIAPTVEESLEQRFLACLQ